MSEMANFNGKIEIKFCIYRPHVSAVIANVNCIYTSNTV